MIRTLLCVAAASCIPFGEARAFEVVSATAATLPTFAMNPAAMTAASAAAASAAAASAPSAGQKFGAGFGGGGFADGKGDGGGRWMIAVDDGVGFGSNFGRSSGFGGLDGAATTIRLGYGLGRFTPFVTTGFAAADPVSRSFAGGLLSPVDPLNNAFATGLGSERTLARFGAGFNYAITGSLSFGMAVSANRGGGF